MTEQHRSALKRAARLLQQNQPLEAAKLLQPLYQQEPSNLDVAINLGGAYILLKKWGKAVAVLEKAAQEHPHNTMVWSNLGAAYLGTLEISGPAQQRRAVAAYQQALTCDPQAPNVHYNLGLIYKDQQNYAEALQHFQAAVVVDPTDSHARYWIDRLKAAQAGAEPENGMSQADDASRGALSE